MRIFARFTFFAAVALKLAASCVILLFTWFRPVRLSLSSGFCSGFLLRFCFSLNPVLMRFLVVVSLASSLSEFESTSTCVSASSCPSPFFKFPSGPVWIPLAFLPSLSCGQFQFPLAIPASLSGLIKTCPLSSLAKTNVHFNILSKQYSYRPLN